MTACKGAGSQRFVCEQLEAVVAFLLQSCTRDLVIKPRPHHKIYKGWQKRFRLVQEYCLLLILLLLSGTFSMSKNYGIKTTYQVGDMIKLSCQISMVFKLTIQILHFSNIQMNPRLLLLSFRQIRRIKKSWSTTLEITNLRKTIMELNYGRKISKSLMVEGYCEQSLKSNLF